MTRSDAAGSGAGSGEIRDEIRRTRADMDSTVDELAERLRPRHLIDDLVEVFRGKAHQMGGGSAATSGGGSAVDEAKQYGSALVGKLKNHPMPAALIGAGLAWLLFDQARDATDEGSSWGTSKPGGARTGRPLRAPGRWRDEDLREVGGSFVDARTGEPYDESYGAEYRASPRTTAGAPEALTDSAGTAGAAAHEGGPGIVDKAKDAASRVGEKISEAASAVKESISGAASGTASAASDYGRRAGEWTGSAYDSARGSMRRGYGASRGAVEQALNEYPLAAAGAALAAGVLAGLLLPGTRAEDRLMGEQAARLKDGAKDAGRDVLQRGQQVASQTANALAGEAQQQGLTPDTLMDKAKRVALDVADAARSSAHREGLDDLGEKAKAVAQHGRDVAQDEARRQKDELRSS